MRKADIAPTMKPKWTPRPLPGNEATFAAFRIVQNCREVTINGLFGFNWQNVATKLNVHDLWTPEIERKLSLIEAYLVKEEKNVANDREMKRKDTAERKPKRRRGR